MKIKKMIQKVFLAKSFRIELDDVYCFPSAKDFIFPTSDIVINTIIKYANNANQHIEFLSTKKPIIFLLGETKCEKYEAELKLGQRPLNQGYYIMCHKKFD